MLAHDIALALDPSLLMQLAGFTPDPWQRDLLRSNFSRQLLLCARQTGKSTTAAVLALHEALYRNHALVLLLSPSLRQSQELFRKLTATYAALPSPAPVTHQSSMRLEWEFGSRIISLPGKEETIRGYSGVTLLIIDESSRVPDELYFAVRPMLATSAGRMICLSTPFGRQGFFYDEWTSGTNWDRLRITADQCPRIPPQFLKEERQALGHHWFAQEYLCEFLETPHQVFGRDLIMSAFDAKVQPLFHNRRRPDNELH